MIRISELIINFLLNAAWQIVLVALLALIFARLLRNAPARYRHGLWVAALLLCIVLPFWSLFGNAQAPDRIVAQGDSTFRPSGRATSTTIAAPAPGVVAAADNSPQLNDLFRNRRQAVVTNGNLLVVLALGYALFVLYRISRLWRSWRRTRMLRLSVFPREIPARITAVAAKCQAALRLESAPLVCSKLAPAPVTIGGRKPLVILPDSFYQELSQEPWDETIYSVLGHEMAHIARRDFAFNLIYEFLLLPISFHPLTKFIKRQIDRTRELACDEMVTDRLLEPGAHARSLVRVARSLIVPADQAFMLGIFDADILEERIMKLTRNTRRFSARAGRLLALTSISLLCFSCLTISTFSLELRTRSESAEAVNPVDSLAGAPQPGDELLPGKAQRTQEPGRTLRVESEPALSSANPQQRAQAACDAGKRHMVDAIPRLVSMLGDDAATESLKCWGDGKWNPALDTFKQPSPGEQAAIALASMGLPAFEPLTNALSSSNSSVRRNAAWAIGELTNMFPQDRSDAVVPLISLLSDTDVWVRMAAARALGELRDERAGEPLVAALLDGESSVRQITAWALGEMKNERAVQSLCNLLVSDAQAEVRLAAAEALGEIRSPKAISSLNMALNDSEPRVRARVKWAIAEIEDSDG
ncbi:MAG: M56 family metallopeptidase [Pyrinomonadaceae bacterium]